MSGLKKLAGAWLGMQAIKKVTGWLGDAVTAGRESNKISAQTAAVLKSTGGAANITAKGVSNLATAISKKTGIDDEQIQSSANMLLTFTNVRNEVGKGNNIFDRATQTITDMSAALGQDGKSSALQLGKALNDPIKGITALSRVGVSFTDQQKKQIKTMTESGDKLGAQKIILGELQKEFGGSAEAMATPWDKLKVQLGNIQETVGQALIPILDRLATFAADNLPAALAALGTAFDAVKGFVMPVVQTIQDFVTKLQGGMKGGSDTASKFGQDMSALKALVVQAFNGIKTIITDVVTVVTVLWNAFGQTLVTFLVNSLGNVIAALRGAFNIIIGVFNLVKDILTGNWKGVWKDILQILGGFMTIIGAVVRQLWNIVKTIFRLAWIALKAIVMAGVNAVIGIVKRIVSNIRSTFTSAWNGAKTATQSIWNGIKSVVSNAIGDLMDKVRGIKGKITGAFSGAIGWLRNAGTNIIKGLIGGIDSMIDTVKSKLKSLTNLIPKLKGPASKDKTLLRKNGQLIIQGLVAGFKDKESLVKNNLKVLTNNIGNNFGMDLQAPALAGAGGSGSGNTYQITIKADATTDKVALGRNLIAAIDAYESAGGRRRA